MEHQSILNRKNKDDSPNYQEWIVDWIFISLIVAEIIFDTINPRFSWWNNRYIDCQNNHCYSCDFKAICWLMPNVYCLKTNHMKPFHWKSNTLGPSLDVTYSSTWLFAFGVITNWEFPLNICCYIFLTTTKNSSYDMNNLFPIIPLTKLSLSFSLLVLVCWF